MHVLTRTHTAPLLTCIIAITTRALSYTSGVTLTTTSPPVYSAWSPPTEATQSNHSPPHDDR